MSGGWLAAGLLLLGASGADTDVSAQFAPALPAGVVADVSGWQVVTGSFETTTEAGAYRLYVNPARSALYQLMRYRVALRSPKGPLEQARGGAERIAFVARPGTPEPMLCWERVALGEPAWREVPAGTDAYVLEMAMLMRVLAAHRTARTAIPTP